MHHEAFPPLLEQLPIGVYRSSLDGLQLRANAALVRLNGYASEAELLAAVRDIGREWYVLPTRRAQFAQALERDGEVLNFVSEVHRHKTRERIWIRETAHLVRNAQGQPVYYEGTVQDITAEHLAQEAVVLSERRFRALTDRAQVLTLVCDVRGQVLYASQASRSLLGQEPHQVVGLNKFSLVHPDDVEEAKLGFTEVVQRRNPGTESLIRLRHADGSWRTIAALGQSFMDDPAVGGIVLNYRDVSERERALLAVRQSQDRYRAAFAASPDALILSRLSDGCYLEVNDTFVELSGYSRDELIGRTSVEMHIWPDALTRADFVAELARAGRVRHHVAAFQGRGDRRGVVEISAELLEIDGERCVLAIARDITQSLATRRALEESEARLRLALHAAHQGLWDLDVNSRQVVASDEYARLLGLPPRGSVQTHDGFYARLHSDDVAPMRQAVRDYLSGDGSGEFTTEFRQRHADGHWVWLLCVGRGVDTNESGRPQRVLGTITDITQRRTAETALRSLANDLERLVAERTSQLSASELRYRNIFELVPMAIVEEDWSETMALLQPHRAAAAADPGAWLRGHPDVVAACMQAVHVVRLNPAAAALYGLAYDDHSQRSLTELFAVYDSSDGFTDELASLLAGKNRHDQLRNLRRADGGRRHVQLAVALPDLNHPGDGTALASLLDVTDLKRLSTELDLSLTHLRRAHRELETFTHSVSHDLKAPLRGLDGYSQLLLEHYGEQLDEEGRGFLRHIRGATRQMAQITDDLLAYARLERSEQTLGAVALDELVSAVLADVAGSLQHRHIVPALDVPPLAVWADSKGLKMVLRNLVDNAIKFSAAVGQPALTIGAEVQVAEPGVAGTRVRLWVRDNGVGFDMGFHDRIFQIFQRLHRAEDFPGTGVGLAMVAKAMDRMGGRVWAQSTPGQGAIFYLELPALAGSSVAASTGPGAAGAKAQPSS